MLYLCQYRQKVSAIFMCSYALLLGWCFDIVCIFITIFQKHINLQDSVTATVPFAAVFTKISWKQKVMISPGHIIACWLDESKCSKVNFLPAYPLIHIIQKLPTISWEECGTATTCISIWRMSILEVCRLIVGSNILEEQSLKRVTNIILWSVCFLFHRST